MVKSFSLILGWVFIVSASLKVSHRQSVQSLEVNTSSLASDSIPLCWLCSGPELCPWDFCHMNYKLSSSMVLRKSARFLLSCEVLDAWGRRMLLLRTVIWVVSWPFRQVWNLSGPRFDISKVGEQYPLDRVLPNETNLPWFRAHSGW